MPPTQRHHFLGRDAETAPPSGGGDSRRRPPGHEAAARAGRRSAGRPLPWRPGPRAGAAILGSGRANERLRRGGRGARAGVRGAGALRLSSVPAMEAPAARLLPPLLLLLSACAPAPGRASSDAPPLVNEDVKRTVDLSSHLAKVTAEVVLAHAGSGSSPRAASFLLALEPELEARLAHLGVQVSGAAGRRGGGAARRPPRTRQHRPAARAAGPRPCGVTGSRLWSQRSEAPISCFQGCASLKPLHTERISYSCEELFKKKKQFSLL